MEQVIIEAIKKDIAIYAAHTNLDNIVLGVNGDREKARFKKYRYPSA